MDGNNRKVPGEKYGSDDLELFDELSLYLKKFYWTAPVDIATNGDDISLEEFKVRNILAYLITRQLPRLTIKTYGENHPQAGKPYRPIRL